MCSYYRVYTSSSSCSIRSFRGKWRRDWICSRGSSRFPLQKRAWAWPRTPTTWRWPELAPNAPTTAAPMLLPVHPTTPTCLCLSCAVQPLSMRMEVKSRKLLLMHIFVCACLTVLEHCSTCLIRGWIMCCKSGQHYFLSKRSLGSWCWRDHCVQVSLNQFSL